MENCVECSREATHTDAIQRCARCEKNYHLKCTPWKQIDSGDSYTCGHCNETERKPQSTVSGSSKTSYCSRKSATDVTRAKIAKFKLHLLEEEYKLRERHLKEREQALQNLIKQREKEVLDLQQEKEVFELNFHRKKSELLLASLALQDADDEDDEISENGAIDADTSAKNDNKKSTEDKEQDPQSDPTNESSKLSPHEQVAAGGKPQDENVKAGSQKGFGLTWNANSEPVHLTNNPAADKFDDLPRQCNSRATPLHPPSPPRPSFPCRNPTSAPLDPSPPLHPTFPSHNIPRPVYEANVNKTVMRTLTADNIAARKAINTRLPMFSGKPKEWQLFITKYDNTTLACGYSNLENISRLQDSLTGEALEAVKSRLNLPEQVPIIIETLRTFFGRADIVVNELIEELRSENDPTMDDFNSFTNYALKVSNLVAQMTSNNLSEYLWDQRLLNELVQRLPPQWQMKWASYYSSAPVANLEVFGYWINNEAIALSRISPKAFQFTGSVNESKQNKKTKAFVNLHSATDKLSSCITCKKSCDNVGVCDKFLKSSLSEKWTVVKENGICRKCLRKCKNRCSIRKACGVDGCTYLHNKVLHNKNPTNETPVPPDGSSEVTPTVADVHTHHQSNSSTIFKVVPIRLFNGSFQVDSFAMLDACSSLTLVEKELADILEVQGKNQPICLRWTGGQQRYEAESLQANIEISRRDTPHNRIGLKIRTISNLDLPQQSVSAEELHSKYPYLKRISLDSYNNAKPGLIIGLDNPRLVSSKRRKVGGYNDPVAEKTELGWTISQAASSEKNHSNYHICECDSRLENLMRSHFDLDLSTVASNDTTLSKDDQRAIEIMRSTTKLLDGRFETGLIWRYDAKNLPDSKGMALRRFHCFEKSLLRRPEVSSAISSMMEDYIRKGYVRKISNEEKLLSSSQYWYLPTFVVINPNKPGKVRIVWDAAAKVGNISLNSFLLKGPDMLKSLPGVLYRFREKQVGLTGDIREMFHQVRIRQEDQNYQRFFWRFKPDEEPETLICNVMTFGATCSPTCAQFVKNENAKRFSEQYPEAFTSITENHYVDDLLQSTNTEDEAINIAREVRMIHAEAGYEIRNWVSNSKSVTQALNSNSTTIKDLNLCHEDYQEKVLGMWWVTSRDKLTYSLKYTKCHEDVLKGKRVPTKREMLRLLMSIYDPLGLLAHVMIYPKILMQDVWRTGLDWDEALPSSLYDKWFPWVQHLKKLCRYKVPRCYNKKSYERVELHTFTDASLTGYAAAVFFRFISENGVKCSLIAAKSRVSPLKIISVPRLELMAAALGVKLANNIIKEHTLEISSKFFWTDSSTVLSWIKSDHRKYSQFVAFRVADILEGSTAKEWRWVPTASNVADMATKMKIPSLRDNKPWFHGPDFLYESEEDWPKQKVHPEETVEEIRPQFQFSVCHHLVDFDTTVFSDWNRMQRSQAYVLRFIYNIRARTRGFKLLKCPLLMKELRSAETMLFKKAQRECYGDEIAILSNGDTRVPKSSSIYKDIPFIDEEGVLRANTRLPNVTTVHYDTRFPILMPKDHRITDLLLMNYHKLYKHHNHETVLNEVVQRFQIPTLRVQLKKIRSICQLCKNKSASPEVPTMSQLPEERVAAFVRPFSYIGVDFFGPISVACRRSRVKRWVMIITCLTIRAIHLEVAHSLNTDSCILALQRFICRRGKPLKIFSDNATNFHGSSNELKSAVEKLDKDRIAATFIDSQTEWSFIPPASPHMGGAWERMVRSVKTTLDYAMPTRSPTDEVLLSMLAFAEFTVNSRPLTSVPIDNESCEAITPNHFLVWSSNGSKPNVLPVTDGDALRRNWCKSERFGALCFQKFVASYLPMIRKREKWWEDVPDLKKNDIVVVADANNPKREWPKGLVIAVHPSKDGKIRSATVKMNGHTYIRPVAKLAVLDVRRSSSPDDNDYTGIPGGSIADRETTI